MARNLRVPAHRRPTTPGEMLNEEFLKPLGITQSAFAKLIGTSFPRLNEIVNGRRGVSPDTALRFARATGMSPSFWLNLQQLVDLYDATTLSKAKEIAKIRPLKTLAKANA